MVTGIAFHPFCQFGSGYGAVGAADGSPVVLLRNRLCLCGGSRALIWVIEYLAGPSAYLG